MKKISFIALILQCFYGMGQVNIPGNYLTEIDKLNDTTTLSFYPSIRGTSSKKFELLPALVKGSGNLAYPRGYNDGAIWKGKGINAEIHAGVHGSLGKLSYTFQPLMAFAQNASFTLAPQLNASRNQFNYQFNQRIDWVQQYGPESFIYFHPGQSQVKLDFGKFSTSVSTQNYSAGPSTFNPIILSRNAGGFPHLSFDLEPTNVTIRKFDIGKVEAHLLYGLLAESDYFDTDSSNDNRYFNGLFVSYSPSFVPGLTLGLNRILYKQTQFFEAQDLISPFIVLDDGIRDDGTDTGNDFFDGMASFTAEWKFTEVGFRSYLEYARQDFTGTIRNSLVEPEGGQRAYTLGFEKQVVMKADKTLFIQYEHTNLSRGPVLLFRPVDSSYYTHGVNRQGYTHNGQIIGSGLGPGGTSDNIGLILRSPSISYGFLIQRIETDKDYFNEFVQTLNHDQEYSLGLHLMKRFGNIQAIAEGNFIHNYHRYYQEDIRSAFFAGSLLFNFND